MTSDITCSLMTSDMTCSLVTSDRTCSLMTSDMACSIMTSDYIRYDGFPYGVFLDDIRYIFTTDTESPRFSERVTFLRV